MYLHYMLQVTRFWNKLCRLDHHHLARLAFVESAAAAQLGCDTWVTRVVQCMQAYGVLGANVLHDARVPITKLQIDPTLVRLQFVQRLNGMWANPPSTHTTLYAQTFRVHDHMDTETNMMFDTRICMAKRRTTMRFRVFGCRLAARVGQWYGWTGTRLHCSMCNLNVIEDEHHVLLTCPAYTEFRSTYAQPLHTSTCNMFTPQNAAATASFLHTALAKRKRILAGSTPHAD